MTKSNDKELNHAIENINNEPFFDLLAQSALILLGTPINLLTWRGLQLNQTAKRLSECIMEIKEHGFISSSVESRLKLYDEMRQNYLNGELAFNVTISPDFQDGMEFLGEDPTPTKVLNYAFNNLLEAKKLDKETSLDLCLWHCINLSYLFVDDVFAQATDIEKATILSLEPLVTQIAYEAIGYWTAKLETKKTNKENKKTSTEKKEANKAILKKWLETMTPDQCRIKAQTELGIKDRTYLNYIRELNEEKNQKNRDAKTALMRKNDVSANS